MNNTYYSFLFLIMLGSFWFTESTLCQLTAIEFQNHYSDSGEIFEVVEQMPEYPGGENEMFKFITQNFNYPKEAKDKGIEGRVLISFLVNEDGSVSDIKPLLKPEKWLRHGLEEEAMRVVGLMPNWKPGYQKGVAVKVQYILPIVCQLNNDKKSKKKKK
jgi:TonB family protein